MKLTPHFDLSEFVVSQTAAREGIDNTPPPWAIDNLRELTRLLLEPLRAILRAPILISSGYRCPELNARVGGAPNSDHMQGCAADFTCPGAGPVMIVCQKIRGVPGLPFHQLIREFDQDGQGWVHLSWHRQPRRQVLTIDRAGTREEL